MTKQQRTKAKPQPKATAVNLAELEGDLAYYEKQRDQIMANLNATLGAMEYVKMKIERLKSGTAVIESAAAMATEGLRANGPGPDGVVTEEENAFDHEIADVAQG